MVDYTQDFYGWTQEQAGLLRTGQWQHADMANIIEEIETMGRSERRELENRLTVLLVHLLKWRYQANRRGRSWQLTIKEQRLEVQDVLADNPSLKSQLDTLFAAAYIKACVKTHLDEQIFPATCPWTLQQLSDFDFYPDA